MKIGIVGSGMVGSTAAYAVVMRGVGREIILVDKSATRAAAEASDINHAIPFANPLSIRAGDFPDLKGCKAIVITAGVSQKPGETRLQLLQRNAVVFREVIPLIFHHAPDAVLIVATNPVDVMTHLAARHAADLGLPSGRVLGSGTTLDTARFRTLLGAHLEVDPRHIHGYVVGEHGDSEVLTWSLVTVGGMPLEDFCALRGICLDDNVRQTIDNNVRRAAYGIIEGKGATYYGIGSALAQIIDVILHDQRSILTVCTPMANVEGVLEVTVSLPHLVGGNGAMDTFPLPMAEMEREALRNSASVVRKAIDALEG